MGFSSPSASRYVSWSVSAAPSYVSLWLTFAEEAILSVTVPSAEIAADVNRHLQTHVVLLIGAKLGSSMATRSESLKKSSVSVVLDSGGKDMEEKQELG